MVESKLNKIDIFSIVLGAIIGWGSFTLPGTKFLREAGVINTAFGLILGVICIIIIEKNYEFMLSCDIDEGGEFSYTYKNMGKNHSFVVGWFLTLAYFTMIPLNATAFPLVIKRVFGNILEFGYLYEVAGYDVYLGDIIVSSMIILIFALINIKGLKKTSKVQNFIILNLVLMVMLVFMGMVIKGDKSSFVNTYIRSYSFDLGEIAKVFAITPFAFVGFDAIPQLCKNFKLSPKRASMVAITSLLIGAAIYNILNIITALAYSPEEAMVLEWATGSAVFETLGKVAFLMLIVALCAAVWSGINGFMICSSKLLGGIALHDMLPAQIGHINKDGVFNKAILFITGASLIAPWFGRQVIIWIVDMSSLGAAIAYFYVSLISFRICPSTQGKVFGIIGIMVSILFVLLILLPMSPAFLGKEALILLFLWIGIGVIFYLKKCRN